MSEIRKGDLVMVVRACHYCGLAAYLGKIFVVAGVAVLNGDTECCGRGGIDLCASESLDDEWAWPTRLLIKIDPPQQPESTEHKEDSHAPA